MGEDPQKVPGLKDDAGQPLGTPVSWYDPNKDYYKDALGVKIEHPKTDVGFHPNFLGPNDPSNMRMQANYQTSLLGKDMAQTVPSSGPQSLQSYGLFGSQPTAAAAPTPLPSSFAPTGLAAGGMGAAMTQNQLSDFIKSLASPIDPNLIQQAYTPVPSGHDMQLPPEMQTPLAPARQTPFDERGVVGKKAARSQGIENAFIGVSNAVGSVTRGLAERNRQKTSQATTRLMDAQHQIDVATQALKTAAPEQQKALQDSISRNKYIMNTILGDDKMRKSIEKGLQISFTDPSKNKTDDHTAVAQGRQAFADQFAEKMPQVMQQDPMAQQKLSLAVQQKQADQKLLGSMLPRLMASQDAMQRTMLVQGMINMRQLQAQDFKMQYLANVFANQKDLAKLNRDYGLDKIWANVSWTAQKMVEVFGAESVDPRVVLQLKNKATSDFLLAETRNNTAMTDLNAQLSSLRSERGKPGVTGERQHQIDMAITDVKHQIETTTQLIKNEEESKKKIFEGFGVLEDIGKHGLPQTGGTDGSGTGTNLQLPSGVSSGVSQSVNPETPAGTRASQFGLNFAPGGWAPSVYAGSIASPTDTDAQSNYQLERSDEDSNTTQPEDNTESSRPY